MKDKHEWKKRALESCLFEASLIPILINQIEFEPNTIGHTLKMASIANAYSQVRIMAERIAATPASLFRYSGKLDKRKLRRRDRKTKGLLRISPNI